MVILMIFVSGQTKPNFAATGARLWTEKNFCEALFPRIAVFENSTKRLYLFDAGVGTHRKSEDPRC